MKIKTCVVYNKQLPKEKRQKNFRYVDEKAFVYGELQEIPKESLKIAFSYEDVMTKVTIYADSDGVLWKKANADDFILHAKEEGCKTALQALKHAHIVCSCHYHHLPFWYHPGDGIDDKHIWSKERALQKVNDELDQYRLVGRTLYKRASEPMYVINTFGLGHNHVQGYGTAISITDYYNPNISNDSYYNALEFEAAKAKALKIASGRGDTSSIPYIKKERGIKVYDESLVKRNPMKDHGEGDEFLNSLESLISSSSSKSEAAVLAVAGAMAFAEADR